MWQQQLPTGCNLHDIILWVDGFGAGDRKTGTGYTQASIVNEDERYGGKALTYDGADSKITSTVTLPANQALTATAWISASGWGEGNQGRIFDDGKNLFSLLNTNARLAFQSDGSTTALSAVSSIAIDSTWYFVAVTRNATGDETNLYINSAISGTSDQDSGTPAAGDNAIIVGNRNATDRTFAGEICNLIIFNKVLTQDQIRQMYNKHK